MRELKFKALNSRGNWTYGLPFFSHGTGVWKITYSDGWVPNYSNPDEGESTVYTDVDPHTICQFTELYDENGVEIYEGDIIKEVTIMGVDDSIEQLGVVEYNTYDSSSVFEIKWQQGHTCAGYGVKLYVIGNVHTDKDLIAK